MQWTSLIFCHLIIEAAFKKYMIFKSLLIHLLIIQSGKRIETQKQHCSQLRTLQNCFRWCTFFIQYIIHIHSNSCTVLAAWIFYERLLSSKPSLGHLKSRNGYVSATMQLNFSIMFLPNPKFLWSIMSKTNVPCQHSTNPYFLSRKWEKNVKEEGKKDQEHRISWNTNTKESLNLRVTTSKNVQLNIYQRETQNCIEN